MRIRVLGPVEIVDSAGGVVAVGRVKPASVLAFLVIHARTRVSVERLVHAVWGESPPATAVKTLQTYVAQIRRLLGERRDVLVTSAGGYRLDVADDAVDARRFERLVRHGHEQLVSDVDAARQSFADALALWRGVPYADLVSAEFARAEATRLEEVWFTARQGLIETRLRTDGAAQVVAELRELTRRHPLREGLWAQLLRALYASGRQAEALEAYAQVRELLAGELGVDPGPELRDLEHRILTHTVADAIGARVPGSDQPKRYGLGPHAVATVQEATALQLPASSLVGRQTETVRPSLVGRAAELTRLHREFERSAVEGSRCLLMTGDPGLGKTRLCTEFATRRDDTALVMTARGYPLGATEAFGLWSEALDGALGRLGRDELVEVCGGFLDDLAILLRSVAAVHPPPAAEYSRRRLLDGLVFVLRQLGAHDSVVVILDDVHLADAASVEALAYLTRNLSDTPLLVVATARPSELADHQLARDVALGLEQEHLLTRMPLTPLDRAALRDLAGSVIDREPVPDALIDWLTERSRGYPLFALGLLHAVVEEGADLAAPQLRQLPEGLQDRVASRASRLTEPARATLELLAVVGRQIPVDDLVWLSARPLERLGEILEELERGGLVAEHGDGPALAYDIAHPLIGEAVYARVGAARRRALHRRVARSLLDAGHLSAAAPHFARSAEPGDPEAIDALCQAVGQAEARESYREEVAILEALLELLPEGDPRWLDVLDAMALTPEWLPDHRADVGTRTAIRALQCMDTVLRDRPDRVKRATVHLRLATLHTWGAGSFDDALDSERQAVALFEEAELDAPARLARVELAYIHWARGEWDAGLNQCRAVLADAETAGDVTAAIWALQAQGTVLMYQGLLPASREALRRSTALADKQQLSPAAVRGQVLLSISLQRAGQLAAAAAALERAAAWDNAVYADTIFYEVAANLAWFRGDLPAVMHAARELTARHPGALSLRRAWGLAVAARAAAEMSRLGEARDLLARADAVYGGETFLHFTLQCSWAAGALRWIHGAAEDAVVQLQQVAREFEHNNLPASCPVLVDLCEVSANAGKIASAARAAERLDLLATHLATDVASGMAALGNAWHRLAARDHERALSAAEEAIHLLDATGHALLAGSASEAQGRALLIRDRRQACDALEKAAETFDACQAVWRRDRVRRLLKGLGHRGRRAAASTGSAALSAREQEVVELAADGYTAREIAAHLFIGKRTVETHIANAYTKLGVSNRRELREWARNRSR